MRKIALRPSLVLVCIALFALSCTTNTTAPVGTTDTAYFDKDHLNWMMGTSGCEGLRFYTALRGPKEKVYTALVIPLDKNGKELYNWKGPWYQRYERVDGSRAVVTKLLKDAATTSVLNVRNAGTEPWSADFTSKELTSALNMDGANGLRVDRTSNAEGERTFLIAPVSIVDGVARTVGDGTSVTTCVQPCPNLCPSIHLHR